MFSQSLGTSSRIAVASMLLVILVRDALSRHAAARKPDHALGTVQPGRLRAAGRTLRSGPHAARHAGLAGDRRSRPFQVDQRHVRPCRRRRGDRQLRRLPALGHRRASSAGGSAARNSRYFCREPIWSLPAVAEGAQHLRRYDDRRLPERSMSRQASASPNSTEARAIRTCSRADKALYLAKESGRDSSRSRRARYAQGR